MISLYIFIEFTLLILFILFKILKFSNEILNIFRIIPIIINLLVVFNKNVNRRLKLALIISLIADIFFLYVNSCPLGISLFIVVQLIYHFYLNNKNNSFIFLLSILNILLVLKLNYKILIIEGVIYGIISILNITKATILSKNDNSIKYFKYSLIILFLCDICILTKFIYKDIFIIDILERLFYNTSQVILVIYVLKEYDSLFYKILQPLFKLLFKIYYNPKVINKEYIPINGAAVIAGNHKHALDPILVDYCTKRVVHTLAKKDLHDGPFGWFFKGIGTIPVDLKASKNHNALVSAIDYLKNDSLINVSPEAKRNFTKEILLPFKPGAVVMAKRSNCKIIPYSITGDYKFRSKNLKITFGKPLDVSSLSVEEANELLYKTIKKLIIDARK